MTRAKRILRIVGDSNLFLQGSQDSILRKLIIYCNEHGLVQDDPRIGKHKKDAWRKPDWALTAKCLWKPTMTAKFHHVSIIVLSRFVMSV